jgi:hypothetical protein
MSAHEAEAGRFESDENIERLLKRAFAPVDPPPHLYAAFEDKLEQVSINAAEELSDWELAAMRDPRNWVKPAVAVVAGGTAAGALLVLGLRSRRREEDKGAAAVKALSGALGDVRREIERSARRGFK